MDVFKVVGTILAEEAFQPLMTAAVRWSRTELAT